MPSRPPTRSSFPMTVVSVIAPTYHAAKWVATTIDSVIAQTYRILSSSSWTTARRATQYQWYGGSSPQTSRTTGRSSRFAQPGCKPRHNNEGLSAANGSWVQFLDSDDLIPPTKFERQMAYCARAPDEVTAIYSLWRRCFLDNGSITWEGPLIEPDMEGRAPPICLVGGQRPLHSAGLARRSTLEQIGGFDEALRFWECEEVTSASQWPADLRPCRRQTLLSLIATASG